MNFPVHRKRGGGVSPGDCPDGESWDGGGGGGEDHGGGEDGGEGW